VPLSHDWIDAYEARRTALELHATGIKAEDVPKPHEVRRGAMDPLVATRAHGHRAGLVVLATGLGKTFLAAFDGRDFDRVLFVAHREEILAQAMAATRAMRPNARLGRYFSAAKDRDADILFASVQTLAKAAHLSGFDPGAFDYVVLDEFHHAVAAATYRKVIDCFEPQVLLGLTATPERAKLLARCLGPDRARCSKHHGHRAETPRGVHAGTMKALGLHAKAALLRWRFRAIRGRRRTVGADLKARQRHRRGDAGVGQRPGACPCDAVSY
jgi:hypothetical protein